MLKILIILFACFSFQVQSQSRGQQKPVWSINIDHSELFFSVSYLTVSEVTGRVHDFRGNITFDHALHLPLEINIALEAKSIDTANKIRDGHLKSEDFLDTDRYPRMSFYSDSIRYLGDSQYLARGELSIKGKTQAHELSFEMSDILEDTWDYQSRFIQFESSFLRSDFGMHWNKAIANNSYLIGDEIRFYGRVQIQPRSSLTPSARHMIPDPQAIRQRERGSHSSTNDQGPSLVEPADSSALELEAPKLDLDISTNEGERHYDHLRDFWWWMAYLSLGLIAFVGLFIMAFQGKTYLADIIGRFGEEYEETGRYGFLSDVIVLILTFVYAWAMWELAF